MKNTIIFEGPILPGSVSAAMGLCGKARCSCKNKKPKLHGPYFRWTGIIESKRTTITIDEATMKECKKRIDRYKKLQAKLDAKLSMALTQAPWLAKKVAMK